MCLCVCLLYVIVGNILIVFDPFFGHVTLNYCSFGVSFTATTREGAQRLSSQKQLVYVDSLHIVPQGTSQLISLPPATSSEY